VFQGHRIAQCIRCHTIHGEGGLAGPDLSKVAARNDREYLLKSLIDPNAKIAPGFGNVTLVLTTGKTLVGALKSEDQAAVVIEVSEGQRVTVPTAQIDERSAPVSAMPSVAKTLTLREIRDVVEYLSTLRQ
jgi:quinoprotein glucose dehydrogenase